MSTLYEVSLQEVVEQSGDRQPYVLVAVFEGIESLETVKAFYGEALALGNQHNVLRVLIDQSKLPSTTMMDRYEFAYKMAHDIGLTAAWRVAVVYQPGAENRWNQIRSATPGKALRTSSGVR